MYKFVKISFIINTSTSTLKDPEIQVCFLIYRSQTTLLYFTYKELLLLFITLHKDYYEIWPSCSNKAGVTQNQKTPVSNNRKIFV